MLVRGLVERRAMLALVVRPLTLGAALRVVVASLASATAVLACFHKLEALSILHGRSILNKKASHGVKSKFEADL